MRGEGRLRVKNRGVHPGLGGAHWKDPPPRPVLVFVLDLGGSHASFPAAARRIVDHAALAGARAGPTAADGPGARTAVPLGAVFVDAQLARDPIPGGALEARHLSEDTARHVGATRRRGQTANKCAGPRLKAATQRDLPRPLHAS